MQNRYPLNAWQEILGNCDVQLFLGATDELTSKYVSDRTGVASVRVESKAKMLNTMQVTNYSPQYRETSSVGKRFILTPDEVLRLPLDEALIILRSQNVMKVKKYDYIQHPESKFLTKNKASSYTPKWANDRFNTPAPSPIRTGNPTGRSGKQKKGGDADAKSGSKTAVPTNRSALMTDDKGQTYFN